jgi:hypothetical protein
MNKSNGQLVDIVMIVIKYFIRRFFRVYIPYFIYVAYIKMDLTYITRYGNRFDTWYEMVTLKSTGWNHLWTV